jgi:hypothetical protein
MKNAMMKKWKVCVARKLPEPLEAMLSNVCDVEANPRDIPEDREVFLQKVQGIDALIADSRVLVNEQLFDRG